MFTLLLIGLPFEPKLIRILGRKKMFIISGFFASLCGVTTLIAKTNMVLIVISSIWGGLTLTGIFVNIMK